jgi:hypothetical protein
MDAALSFKMLLRIDQTTRGDILEDNSLHNRRLYEGRLQNDEDAQHPAEAMSGIAKSLAPILFMVGRTPAYSVSDLDG